MEWNGHSLAKWMEWIFPCGKECSFQMDWNGDSEQKYLPSKGMEWR